MFGTETVKRAQICVIGLTEKFNQRKFTYEECVVQLNNLSDSISSCSDLKALVIWARLGGDPTIGPQVMQAAAESFVDRLGKIHTPESVATLQELFDSIHCAGTMRMCLYEAYRSASGKVYRPRVKPGGSAILLIDSFENPMSQSEILYEVKLDRKVNSVWQALSTNQTSKSWQTRVLFTVGKQGQIVKVAYPEAFEADPKKRSRIDTCLRKTFAQEPLPPGNNLATGCAWFY